MCDSTSSEKSESNNVIHPRKNENGDFESAEEAVTPDSQEYLSESLRYRNFQYSNQTADTDITLLAQRMTISEENDNFYSSNGDIDLNSIEIPIVGYEIMEERARFTVYKLKVENKVTSDFWYVFRRYTDFVRLCNRLRSSHPEIVQYLPRKRWLKNNFDPLFLEERVSGLQTLVNAILNVPDLLMSKEVQDFFCLNEPPVYSETSEESRAVFEALEETISDLRHQIRERDSALDMVQTKLHSLTNENENLRKLMKNSAMKCQKCQKECENLTKSLK